MQVLMLPLLLVATHLAAASGAVIRLGVVLGEGSQYGKPRTSDQEVWATQQAQSDAEAELAGAGGAWSLEVSVVYTGEASNTSVVEKFMHTCHDSQVAIVVGAYVSEETALAISPLAASLGLGLVLPASGLPTLPERSHVVRLWTNDHWQARILAAKVVATEVVILYRDDVSGKGLVDEFKTTYGGDVRLTSSYNASLGAGGLAAPLAAIKAAIEQRAGDERVTFLCHCGSDEMPAILDTMASMTWPTDRTSFVLTDRATPTRSVVSVDARRAFAASMGTRGVLPHIATDGNPLCESLWERWTASGQNTSLFASALSAYDAVRIATRATMLLGAVESSVGAPGLTTAIASTANQTWGASGMMGVDGVGDLYRATYDEYAVSEADGWQVVGEPIDGRKVAL